MLAWPDLQAVAEEPLQLIETSHLATVDHTAAGAASCRMVTSMTVGVAAVRLKGGPEEYARRRRRSPHRRVVRQHREPDERRVAHRALAGEPAVNLWCLRIGRNDVQARDAYVIMAYRPMRPPDMGSRG